jgi:hypothetical protein
MARPRLPIVIVLVVLLFVGALSSYILLTTSAQKPSTQPTTPSEGLSNEEYSRIKIELLELMVKENPRSALAMLREMIKTDNALLRSCHAMVHDIGHEAYEIYGSFGEAVKYQDEICNSGYIHGVIESHFLASVDVFSAMKAVCSPYPLEKYMSWECYHGVGHGLMYYTENDLPRSLDLCRGLESEFAINTCINGVFMENFNADQKLHVSVFLDENDPLFPCPEQDSIYKHDCYLYAPTYFLSLNKNNYTGALALCESAEKGYVDTCARGVGSQAMKENINNPKLVEDVCMKGKPSQVAPCIAGMVGLFINHYGSLTPAVELCKTLRYPNRQVCSSSVQSTAYLF